MASGLLLLGVIILVGFVGNVLFSKTRIPESVFLMVIGILVGPVFNVVAPAFFLDKAGFLLSLALVLVLLESGLSLDLAKTIRNASGALFLTVLVLLLTTALVTLVTVLGFHWPLLNGIFLGIVGSGTTPITVTHLLAQLKVGEDTKTLLVLESILNDVTLIAAATILISLARAGPAPLIHRLVFNELVMSPALGLLAGGVWAFLFLRYLPSHRLTYVFTLGMALVIYDGSQFLGYNGALVVLAFSLFLGNYPSVLGKLNNAALVGRLLTPLQRDVWMVRTVNNELTFLMRTLFFVFLGVVFSPSSLRGEILLVVGMLTLTQLAARYLAARALVRLFPLYQGGVPVITVMVARGFTSTLIALFALQAGLVIDNLVEIVLLLVLSTTLFATLGTALVHGRMERVS